MSFIRQTQQSEYVYLGEGSRSYIYDTGNTVAGFDSYGEWIDALCLHAENADLDRVDELERALEDHYGEHRKEDMDENYKAIGPKPEMAHVVAQHLDRRLDELRFTDDDRKALSEYALEAYIDCPSCGEEWRPATHVPDEQGDVCLDCYHNELMDMEVSADMSDAIEYVEEELPDDIEPEGFHDDEFYARCVDAVTEKDGKEYQALYHQVNEATDEVMHATIEERPVDKDKILTILEQIDE